MRIGFIGAGKMAQAIAMGLVKKGGVNPGSISASARTEESLEVFRQKVGQEVFVSLDNLEVVRRSELIILAVKPQVAAPIVRSLSESGAERLFISVMAGVSTEMIEHWLGGRVRLVRTMPNTPCLIGQGMTAIAAGSWATAEDLALVRQLLETTGQVVEVQESQLDAVTAVSGSGPAYVYHFIEELIRAGVEQGLPSVLARELAVQTVIGAAGMVASTGEAPGDLAAKVKSPGGTTLAACEILEKRHWGGILREAVAAAKKRARELSG